MKYECEDDGGTRLQVEAGSPEEAAVEFCEQTVDTTVEDLPDTITVVVTADGVEKTVYVELKHSLEFTVLG